MNLWTPSKNIYLLLHQGSELKFVPEFFPDIVIFSEMSSHHCDQLSEDHKSLITWALTPTFPAQKMSKDSVLAKLFDLFRGIRIYL